MLPRLLSTYQPHDEDEAAILRQLLQFLQDSKAPYDRNNLTAHVVADAWIVNPARTHVVLVEHALNQVWMAPGGHCDGQSDVQTAAQREAAEETGITNLAPLLDGNVFDIHSGHVPLRKKPWGIEPAHVHFDVCFAFEAPDNTPLKISDESTGLKWVALEEIDSITFFKPHLRRVEKTRAGRLR